LAQQRVNPADVGNEALDVLGAVWRWLVLVAAIAVGTCLGITLFVMLVMDRVGQEMRQVNLDQFPSTTHTWITQSPSPTR
jgi:hypothetical protein